MDGEHGHKRKNKMALTKTDVVDKIETLEDGRIQVRTATVIKDDYVEVTRTFKRKVLLPSVKQNNSWGDTDISGEDTRVQAIANAVWTSEVKTAYQTRVDAATS